MAGVGKPPSTPLLRPDTAKILSGLKNQGYNIQVPGVIYTDVAAYQANVPGAAAKLDTAKALLDSNGIPATPENILQAAQLDNQ